MLSFLSVTRKDLLTKQLAILGMPFGFSAQLGDVVNLPGVSINLKQMVIYFILHAQCSKDASSVIICHIAMPRY